MGEIIPSESLWRVTNTGIDGMHSRKTTQHYLRSTRNNRTRKKSAVEEDPRKSPEENKKNEPSEQLKSTESLKIERPKNKPEKRTKYIKTALEIAKNETPKDRMAKEQARAENANKWTDSSSANCPEDSPSRKELGGRWLRKTAWKSHTQKTERSPT